MLLTSVFSFFMWEIMHATIKKMNKHVMKLQKEVEDARDKLEAHQRVRTVQWTLILIPVSCRITEV